MTIDDSPKIFRFTFIEKSEVFSAIKTVRRFKLYMKYLSRKSDSEIESELILLTHLCAVASAHYRAYSIQHT